eukprot:2884075-Amphidinium_carterae.1
MKGGECVVTGLDFRFAFGFPLRAAGLCRLVRTCSATVGLGRHSISFEFLQLLGLSSALVDVARIFGPTRFSSSENCFVGGSNPH